MARPVIFWIFGLKSLGLTSLVPGISWLGLRLECGGFLAASLRRCAAMIARFLAVFPGGISGGFRLVSRVDRGRTLWRVESAGCSRRLWRGTGGRLGLPAGACRQCLRPCTCGLSCVELAQGASPAGGVSRSAARPDRFKVEPPDCRSCKPDGECGCPGSGEEPCGEAGRGGRPRHGSAVRGAHEKSPARNRSH
jgi:hypothetical protein